MITSAWSDGSSRNGFGSWAYLIETPDGRTFSRSGHAFKTTNNRMELMAAIMVFRHYTGDVRLYSDSQYVVLGATEWSKKWIENGWQLSRGGEVYNRDLWEELLHYAKIRTIEFAWVKGHESNVGNIIVDRLAGAARKLAEGL